MNWPAFSFDPFIYLSRNLPDEEYHHSGATEAATTAGNTSESEGEYDRGYEGRGQEKEPPRRLFMEFYGPIVTFFLWLGLRNSVAEFMTVLVTQLFPLVTVSPLLRLNTRRVDNSGSAGSSSSWSGVDGLPFRCVVYGV